MAKSEIINKCSACINLTDKTTSRYIQYCFDIIGKKIRDFGQFYGATCNLEKRFNPSSRASRGIRRKAAVCGTLAIFLKAIAV